MIPQGNLRNIQEGSGKKYQKNKNDYKCYGCGSDYHFLRESRLKDETSDSSSGGDGGGEGCYNTNRKGSGDWKFIAPENFSTSVTVNGLEYHLCAHCVCKKTKRKGFISWTHSTADHWFPKDVKNYDVSTIFPSPVQEVMFLMLHLPPDLPRQKMLHLLQSFYQFEKQ